MLSGTGLAVAAFAAVAAAQDILAISPKGQSQEIPLLGFGTWNLARNTTEVVAAAIVAGYRHFDCATAYTNQQQIGPGIKLGLQRTGLKREDLWITSKLWTNRHGSKVQSGIEQNLRELGLDYLDLTLMHFPIGNANGKPEYDIVPTWKEMEKFAGTGPGKLTRFIGVSNFNIPQLDELLKAATIKPKVHQYERHPYLQDSAFREHHRKLNLTVTAYAPLGNTNPAYSERARRRGAPGPLLANPIITDIAKQRSCTPAQVVLKWQMDDGVVVHPKAAQAAHMKDNFDAWTKCRLTPQDRRRIEDMEKNVAMTGRFWDICTRVMGLPCYQGLQKND